MPKKKSKSAPERKRAPTKRIVERDILTDPRALTGERSHRPDDVCGACLMPIGNEAQVGLVDRCTHVFHYDCVEKWAKRENSCPQCKQRFVWLASYSTNGDRTSLTRVKKRNQEFSEEEEDEDEEVEVDDEGGEIFAEMAVLEDQESSQHEDEEYGDDVSLSDDENLAAALSASRAAAVSRDVAPDPEEVGFLSEATGRSADECLAALIQHDGNKHEAVQFLLSQVVSTDRACGEGSQSSGSSGGTVAAEQSSNIHANAQMLVDLTGRSLAECLAALRENGDSVDTAALSLLSGAAAVETSESKIAAGASESDRAARLAETTSRSLPECVQALRSCHGRLEAAAAQLLSLPELSTEKVPGEPSAATPLRVSKPVPAGGAPAARAAVVNAETVDVDG